MSVDRIGLERAAASVGVEPSYILQLARRGVVLLYGCGRFAEVRVSDLAVIKAEARAQQERGETRVRQIAPGEYEYTPRMAARRQ